MRISRPRKRGAGGDALPLTGVASAQCVCECPGAPVAALPLPMIVRLNGTFGVGKTTTTVPRAAAVV